MVQSFLDAQIRRHSLAPHSGSAGGTEGAEGAAAGEGWVTWLGEGPEAREGQEGRALGRDLLDWAEQCGLLVPAAPAREWRPPDCLAGESLEPVWTMTESGGRLGMASCGVEGCGVHTVREEDLATWRFSYDGLARLVAQGGGLCLSPLRAADGVQVCVPDRLWYLGPCTRQAEARELFLVRGLRWADGAAMLRGAERLLASPAPALLVWGELPPRSFWEEQRPLCPAVASLCEQLWATPDGRLRVGLDWAWQQEAKPAGCAQRWITGTEGARMLCAQLSHLSLQQARWQISRAIRRGQIGTNGLERKASRLDQASFHEWVLRRLALPADTEGAEGLEGEEGEEDADGAAEWVLRIEQATARRAEIAAVVARELKLSVEQRVALLRRIPGEVTSGSKDAMEQLAGKLQALCTVQVVRHTGR